MGSSKKHKTEKEKHVKEKSDREKAKSKHFKDREKKKKGDDDHKLHLADKERGQNRKSQMYEKSGKKKREIHKKETIVIKIIKTELMESALLPNICKTGEIALSVGESNKLRAKLGLKPLETDNKSQGIGGDDYLKNKKDVHVPAKNIGNIAQTEKLKEKLINLKEKRQYDKKLSQIATLGDNHDDDDVHNWIQKSRLLEEEKKIAAKRAKLLEEMDQEFGIDDLVEKEMLQKQASYTSADLKGLKVEHSVNRFKEGKEMILTLKDKDVLKDDGDALVNVNFLDDERYEKNVENLKRKPTYQPYEEAAEEEWDEELGKLRPKSLLRKYDEEIEGPQKEIFQINEEHVGQMDSQYIEKKQKELIRQKLAQKNIGISLSLPPAKLAAEYYTSEELKFKKVKRKIKVRKKLKADDLLLTSTEPSTKMDTSLCVKKEINNSLNEMHTKKIEESSDMDEIMDINREYKSDNDDDLFGPNEDLSRIILEPDEAEQELQWALNKSRKLQQKQALGIKLEKVVQQSENEGNYPSGSKGAIVMNETAEFCRSLGEIPTYGMSGNRDEDAEGILDFEREMEQQRREEQMSQGKSGWNEINADAEEEKNDFKTENVTILEEEPDVGKGVAAALKLALSKGYLERDEKKSGTASRNAHLLHAQNYSIEDKNFADDDRHSRRERYNGPLTDFKEKHGYKPDIKLEYIDDQGRILTAKEAFRHLSHKFHGKGSGKNKTEKRAKKLIQEALMKQMSSTDTPLSTLSKLISKQKETQSPFVVLSGGNKQTNL